MKEPTMDRWLVCRIFSVRLQECILRVDLIVSGDTEPQQKVIDWMSPLDFREKQEEVLADREPDTGRWFFQSPKFKDWVDGRTKVLWCHGIRK